MTRAVALAGSCLLAIAVLGRVSGAAQTAALPEWAYGVAPAGAPRVTTPPAPADDGSAKHVPDSTQAFTLTQLRDGFTIADWFPADHPPAPSVVLAGRRPDLRACGLCHYPNGRGRPENAGLNALPAVYLAQQMTDFAHGHRASAESRKTNTALMAAIAKAMTPQEIAEVAEYFSSIPRARWIRVVETATVPKTRLSGGMFVPLEGSETEPIAGRIIEVPEHPDRTDLRDPRSGFVAYVPAGSLARGEAIAAGRGGVPACAVCHGDDLNGLGPVPGLAGRSPSYAVRQLSDMKAGTRHGLWTDLMTRVVTSLSPDDMAAVAAYLASK